jgi:hypothetical protein
MRFLVAAMFFSVSGCAQGDPTPLPRQCDAVYLIWNVSYEQTKAPPPIYWRRDSCSEPDGIYGVYPWCTFMDGGDKVAGIENPNGYYVEVGAPSPGFTFSDTALAHELLHAAIGDHNHTSPTWETIPTIDAALKANGL